jgi:hypothetical protein
MNLTQLREVLISMEYGTVDQIAAEAGSDRESVEAGLAFWVNRGNVAECAVESGCGPCRSCAAGQPTGARGYSAPVYEWVGEKGRKS